MSGFRKLSKKSLWSNLVTLLCLVVFIGSAFKLATYVLANSENNKVMNEARELYKSGSWPLAQLALTSGQDSKPKPTKFDRLLEKNPDTVGWLQIGDTQIDYPVVQASDNDYYLSRNYEREPMETGSIFMDFRNHASGDERHTIIYGHRMKNGSMFGDLKKYLDPAFFQSHRTFFYESLHQFYRVDIFAVYYTTTEFNYIQTDFGDDDEYASFLHAIQNRSIYETNEALTASDSILTLSTCDYTLDSKEGRLVIHGKLTPLTE
ncbi:class B sortase [Paenibacillus anseongensis]|uniref:class B sortase n=1 Tax=Paenibacillus sp. CGMCC 1.16610 TaxID=2755557 RepID=UPI0037C9386D